MEICDLAKALDAFYEIGKERKECNALVQCFGIKYADIIEVQHISPNDIVEKSMTKSYKIVLAILSKLISKLTTTKERKQIVKDIYMRFQRFPNIGEIQIWMQHITYKLPHSISYTEDICKIVNKEPGVELWNNDWVNDVYKRTFPQYKICTDWIRDSFTPIIDIDEVSLFDIY